MSFELPQEVGKDFGKLPLQTKEGLEDKEDKKEEAIASK